MTLRVPRAYKGGYEAARRVDRKLAEAYVRHTEIGDPRADAVIEELAEFADPAETHRIIARALQSGTPVPDDLPDGLRSFVDEASELPEWFDVDLAHAGTLAFLRNSDIVMLGLVSGAIVEGFGTMISRSFRIRSRLTQSGVRRLRQNMLQLVEQFMPGGILPNGDGWRLSLRIRLVHAQARKLLLESEEWDREADGMPISMAHTLLGAAAFSGRIMEHVGRLGGDFSEREREGYCHVWRYTGQLIGVPDEIMFRDYAEAVRCFQIGAMCEPPTDEDAIILANSIINSAPLVLGIKVPEQRKKAAARLYRVSRELIGSPLADALRYPSSAWWQPSLVAILRWQARTDRVVQKVAPGLKSRFLTSRLHQLLEVSDMGSLSHSYALPTSLYDEESSDW